jgi:MoxR-like ATPase
LYSYDALARLRDASLSGGSKIATSGDIGRYIHLGPLGTALLPYGRPRVLLIDELDKSDIDLPSDLLTVFEEGEFEIPELLRISTDLPSATVQTFDGDEVTIAGGKVNCYEFPLVIITSNGERDFPPPFLRRCLQLELKAPSYERLTAIVRAHLGDEQAEQSEDLITTFLARRKTGDLATDQLLNAIYLRFHQAWEGDKDRLVESVLQYLNSAGE